MSAFVVSATHVDLLLSIALHGPSDSARSSREWSPPYLEEAGAQLSAATCSPLGAALLAECIASVSYRYPEDAFEELPGPIPMPRPEQYEFTDFGPCATIAETCKAIACYTYQSSEHLDWEGSTAHSFCERLRTALTGSLRGYEQAPWEWTPEMLAVRGLIPSSAAVS
jgi:hypothetical protein